MSVLLALVFDPDFTAIREFAPWAMMLAGFGGVGAVVRVRREPLAATEI
ncbi:MAG: hypothetical protein JWO83_1478 [Caulobacteraceae bacterium]|nr:hypothetical protein [Caulobacteraceae bacterium]